MRWTLISAPMSWWPLHRAAYPQYHGGAGNHRWFIAGKRDCVAVRLPEHGRHSVLRRDYDHRRGVHQFHVGRSASYCGSLFGKGGQLGLQPGAVGPMHCPSDTRPDSRRPRSAAPLRRVCRQCRSAPPTAPCTASSAIAVATSSFSMPRSRPVRGLCGRGWHSR